MVDPLSANDVQVQFYERAGGTAFVGYETNQTESTRLYSELQFVVTTVLQEESVDAIEGATFHTDAPIIASWKVKSEWARRYREESLPTVGLLVKVLRGSETVAFQ